MKFVTALLIFNQRFIYSFLGVAYFLFDMIGNNSTQTCDPTQ